MKNLNMAIRSLFKKGRSNGIKILSLGVGLAMGLVLISKVCFERSYDDFYQDNTRIYQVQSDINKDGKKDTWGQVSGAIAPGMKAEIPEVEVATRYTRIGSDKEVFVTPDKKRYKGTFLMADSCFFDVFPRRVLLGDIKEVLARPGYVMVSRSIAEMLGGVSEAVGKTFVRDSNPQAVCTIGGVFEDVPENTHLRYDILLSLAGMSERSTTNWIGNDRYRAYVKLHPDTDPESLAPSIRKMQERNQDMESLKKSGVDLSYSLLPLEKLHSDTKEVKEMNGMLLFLALILILTAVLNYVLIVISTLIGRTKEVAVHKCYGASEKNILNMILSETFLHMLLSLLLAGFLIVLFRETVEELLAASLSALFTLQTTVLLVIVCLLVFAITGLIPTYLFMRIPVASAFRSVRESKRYWKLCLLFVQFVATAYLVSLLIVINRQYDIMVNDNPGYKYENLLYCHTAGVDSIVRERTIQELRRLPDVDLVTVSSELPIYYPSGNNVGIPNDDRELFNIADMYWVGDGYFPLMEIPVIDGEIFRADGSSKDKIMVSRKLVEKMEQVAGWKGSAVGKSICITEHSQSEADAFTICGVYDDFRIGSIQGPDMRPSVFFFYDKSGAINSYADYILIKLHHLNSESILKVADLFEAHMPDKNIQVTTYKSEMVNMYNSSRLFRNSIMIGGLVTLIIALIGLLGYTNDETSRRGREIAIRKVNGATARDILLMISKDISLIAIPALTIGAIVARISGEGWLEKFAEKIPLSLSIFFVGTLVVYVIIISCVLFRAWNVANENPIDSIKFD